MIRKGKRIDDARRLLRWDATAAKEMLALGDFDPADIERAILIEQAKVRPRKKLCRVLAKHLPAQ
jgi:hypothetical protein